MGLNFDLLEQLTFYGSYHHNKWNQVIHFIFVPAILFSAFVWLAYIPAFIALPDLQAPVWLTRPLLVNVPLVVVSLYICFYLALDLVAGFTWALAVGLPLWWGSTYFQQAVPHAWGWAIGLHLFSWYMQIHPGHGIFEKRKPALMDSLVQAFALAPLFVWFELLFLLGYRRELYKQLQARVAEVLAASEVGSRQEKEEKLLQSKEEEEENDEKER